MVGALRPICDPSGIRPHSPACTPYVALDGSLMVVSAIVRFGGPSQ
jgi:hypothetical protein